MTSFYSLHEPYIDKNDVLQQIKKSINKNEVAIGNNLDKLSNQIVKKIKANFCCLVSSGTSALHLSLNAFKIGKGHEVIIPNISFVASLNSILYTGAKPIFIGVNDNLSLSENLTIEYLLKSTSQDKHNNCVNRNSKRIIKAIMIVHTFGNIDNYFKLIKIAKTKNIKIIEDAAEAFGSYNYFEKQKVYAGNLGDIGCFSFNGNKIITTGGGGAIVSNNLSHINRCQYLSNQAKNNNITFKHNEIGYNYRLSNINACIGLSQIKIIDEIIKIKKNINKQYKILLDRDKFQMINYHEGSNYWLNVIKIKGINIKKMIKYLENNHIQSRPVWFPLEKQYFSKNYEKFGINTKVHPHLSYLCLPSSPILKNKDIFKITKIINKF